jgi:16S rRNA (uracil1498-N3)-methyltransferase
MKQFVLNADPADGSTVKISGADYHYLVNVRRMCEGETFNVLSCASKKAIAEVVKIENGVLHARIRMQNNKVQNDSPTIVLFQSMLKGTKFDSLVRQATQIGVSLIVPFYSRYSVVKPDKDTERSQRFLRIVKEAVQQSGSPLETKINKALLWEELLPFWISLKEKSTNALGVLIHETDIAQNPALGGTLEKGSFHEYLECKPDLIVAAIGPEGGFSQSEVSDFMKAGFKALTLGNNILRAETAAIYTLAVINNLLLEKSSWIFKKQ